MQHKLNTIYIVSKETNFVAVFNKENTFCLKMPFIILDSFNFEHRNLDFK